MSLPTEIILYGQIQIIRSIKERSCTDICDTQGMDASFFPILPMREHSAFKCAAHAFIFQMWKYFPHYIYLSLTCPSHLIATSAINKCYIVQSGTFSVTKGNVCYLLKPNPAPTQVQPLFSLKLKKLVFGQFRYCVHLRKSESRKRLF